MIFNAFAPCSGLLGESGGFASTVLLIVALLLAVVILRLGAVRLVKAVLLCELRHALERAPGLALAVFLLQLLALLLLLKFLVHASFLPLALHLKVLFVLFYSLVALLLLNASLVSHLFEPGVVPHTQLLILAL